MSEPTENGDKVLLSQSHYRELLAENTRLRKCVSEEWDAVAADKILADVEHLRTINAELLAALTGIMPWTTNNGPDWATPEAMNRNRRMYENAFTAAEIAIEKAKGDEENL